MTVRSVTEIAYAVAFETSSALGSIALGRGPEVLATGHFGAPRKHATDFLPTIEKLCRAHSIRPDEIRTVYVSSGPGSFTGLRIGITVARMIAMATGADVVAVPTLTVIAQNAADESIPPDQVAVILDAKRQRVYAAAFVREEGRYSVSGLSAEVDPTEFLAARPPSCAVMGEGVRYHREVVAASGLKILPESLCAPRAETVYRLGFARAIQGNLADRRTLVPFYIRPPEAEEKWEERSRSGKV